jgi:hypothetical protein
MESSEIKQDTNTNTPKFLLFMLNRNGLEENELRDVMTMIADTQFGAQDVSPMWISILGKLPDRPHALMTLSDDEVAREMAGQTINFRFGEKNCVFEISEAFGTEASDEEDPNMIFLSNVPVNLPQEQLEQELLEFFGAVARPTKIIFPRNWLETRTLLLNFDNVDSAKMIAKAGFICTFKDKLMRCSYARKREQRPPMTKSKGRGKNVPPKRRI